MALLKDQWRTWAADWSLTHVPERGWLRRTERVLGARGGLLFRVSWGGDDDPGLNLAIRFPRPGEPQRVREQLIADASLDALPGKGSARRKMAVELGPVKAIRWGSRPEFLLRENCLIWRRTFPFNPPKVAHLQAWVEALIESLRRATRTFDACETCGSSPVHRYVVVDGLPMWMCESCQQRLRVEGEMASRSYDMSEARHVNGLALAAVAAVMGAIAWAGIGALTHRIFAVAAIGIGALVAYAYRMGAGRVDKSGRVIAAALTVSSVVLGEILMLAWWIAERYPEVAWDLHTAWLAYQHSWATAPADEGAALFFGVMGAWVASQALARPKLAARIEQPENETPRDEAA
jgi:hypothetical protein